MKILAQYQKAGGLTLLELIITVVIVGVLSSIAIPSFSKQTKKAQLTEMNMTLNHFHKAYDMYHLENGSYPPDRRLGLPAEMTGYISKEEWEGTTPLGGNYNWEGPDVLGWAGISIQNPTATESEAQVLDQLIDDGDLTSGRFRITDHAGFRYTYFFELI